jgi:hypothetical protein
MEKKGRAYSKAPPLNQRRGDFAISLIAQYEQRDRHARIGDQFQKLLRTPSPVVRLIDTRITRTAQL